MASRYFSPFPERRLTAPKGRPPSPGTSAGPTKREMPMKTASWPTIERTKGAGYSKNGATVVKTHPVKRGII